jgi:hypothetical protein
LGKEGDPIATLSRYVKTVEKAVLHARVVASKGNELILPGWRGFLVTSPVHKDLCFLDQLVWNEKCTRNLYEISDYSRSERGLKYDGVFKLLHRVLEMRVLHFRKYQGG